MTKQGVFYAVQVTPTTERCTCPHFIYRHQSCKHIAYVRDRYWCTWNEKAGQPQYTPGECPACGAETVTLTE